MFSSKSVGWLLLAKSGAVCRESGAMKSGRIYVWKVSSSWSLTDWSVSTLIDSLKSILQIPSVPHLPICLTYMEESLVYIYQYIMYIYGWYGVQIIGEAGREGGRGRRRCFFHKLENTSGQIARGDTSLSLISTRLSSLHPSGSFPNPFDSLSTEHLCKDAFVPFPHTSLLLFVYPQCSPEVVNRSEHIYIVQMDGEAWSVYNIDTSEFPWWSLRSIRNYG